MTQRPIDLPKIVFHNQTKGKIPQRSSKRLKSFIENIFSEEGKSLEAIDYIFCSDEYLLKLNREFLSHDYYTDILTFCLSEKDSPVQAEIYISIDRVSENAALFQNSPANELLRVIFHGALHLCGYHDKTKIQKRVMREKENKCLEKYSAGVSRET